MYIFVIVISRSYITLHAMNCKIHFTEPDGFRCLFLTIDGYFCVWILLMPLYKFCTLDKHTSRAAGWVINSSMIWLYNFNNEFHKRCWSEKLATSLSLSHCKPAEEVFVNLSKDISFNIHLYARKGFKQCYKDIVFKPVICLGKDILEAFIFCLNSFHGIVNGFSNILTF